MCVFGKRDELNSQNQSKIAPFSITARFSSPFQQKEKIIRKKQRKKWQDGKGKLKAADDGRRSFNPLSTERLQLRRRGRWKISGSEQMAPLSPMLASAEAWPDPASWASRLTPFFSTNHHHHCIMLVCKVYKLSTASHSSVLFLQCDSQHGFSSPFSGGNSPIFPSAQ